MAWDPSRSLVSRRLDYERGAYNIQRYADGVTRGTGVMWDARHFVDPLRFSGGRQGAADEFSPSVLTFSYLVDEFAPNALLVGDRLALSLMVPDEWNVYIDDFTRTPFWVTDMDLEFRRVMADGETGKEPRLRGVVTVTATGALARVAQLRLGATPFPPATGPSRLLAPMQFMADDYPAVFRFFDTTIQQRPPGAETAVLRAADIDRSDPIALAKGYAADSGALLFEPLGGGGAPMVWETADGRRNREPRVTLTADEVARTAHWSRSLAGLVNRLTLTYGPEGDRHEVTVEDPASIAQYGEYATGRETELLYEADALRVATLIVGRNSRPRWSIDRLDFDLLRSIDDPVKAGALASADIGDLIEVAGLPAQAPYSRWLYVEGCEVTVDKHNWRLTLYTSAAGRTGAPLRYQDVQPDLTYAQATVDETGEPLTYLGAAAWFDPPTLDGVYRYLDVPADQAFWHIGLDYFGHPEARDGGDTRVPTYASYPNDPA